MQTVITCVKSLLVVISPIGGTKYGSHISSSSLIWKKNIIEKKISLKLTNQEIIEQKLVIN